MTAPIQLIDCLWVRSDNSEQPLFHPITRALQARSVRCFSLRLKSDPDKLSKLKQLLQKNDDHVILHGLLPSELKALYPIFKDRKNFSLLLIDWWTSPFWFTQNAEYLLFNLYSGIAVRSMDHGPRTTDHGLAAPESSEGGTRVTHHASRITPAFCLDNWRPPWFSWPEDWAPYEIVCSALRPVAVLAQPFLGLQQRRLQDQDMVRPERLIYFPIPVSAEDLPFMEEKPEYDICNSGASCGFWVMRDPYAPAKYNFTNLYSDRKRLMELILRFENRPYKIFDRRRHYGRLTPMEFIRQAIGLGSDVQRHGRRLTWAEYLQAVRRSRFAVVTGGLHQASVPKYIEMACMGTPMIGSLLPYEHPWLDKCLFPIDCLKVTPGELKKKLDEALGMQPRLRQNCLELRDTLLRLYDPLRVLDMAQDQIDGKPIPPGYLRVN